MAVRLPYASFRLLIAPPTEAVDLFERGIVDLVYSWQPVQDVRLRTRPGVAHDVLRGPLWVSLPFDHALAGRSEVSLADLRGERWIVSSDPSARKLLDQACASAGFVPDIAHEVHSQSEARGLLWRGEGVALVSPLLTPPVGGVGFVVLPLCRPITRTHWLLVDPDVVPGEVARAVCEQLRASFLKKAVRRNPRCLDAVDFTETRSAPIGLCRRVAAAGPPDGRADRSAARSLEPHELWLLRVIGAYGSLNRAAPELMISQPALTRRMSRLEEEYGAGLLIRGRRGTTLTMLGKQLVAAADIAAARFAATLDDLRAGGPDASRSAAGRRRTGTERVLAHRALPTMDQLERAADG
jgi:DNA-binding transcriptional LysR family regulator